MALSNNCAAWGDFLRHCGQDLEPHIATLMAANFAKHRDGKRFGRIVDHRAERNRGRRRRRSLAEILLLGHARSATDETS
eukprot:3608633-Amphidinium_carterae.1